MRIFNRPDIKRIRVYNVMSDDRSTEKNAEMVSDRPRVLA